VDSERTTAIWPRVLFKVATSRAGWGWTGNSSNRSSSPRTCPLPVSSTSPSSGGQPAERAALSCGGNKASKPVICWLVARINERSDELLTWENVFAAHDN
jgi:hypothetical protein